MKVRVERDFKGFQVSCPNGISQEKWRLILDIYEEGPDCAKFIARRLGLDIGLVMEDLKGLESLGWIQRVKGTFLMKRGMKRPKHMNHTYYELTRHAELYLRQGLKKRRSL